MGEHFEKLHVGLGQAGGEGFSWGVQTGEAHGHGVEEVGKIN